MGNKYIAFDLGASSGRTVMGELLDNGCLSCKEIHRFPNKMLNINGQLHWDFNNLLNEINKVLIQIGTEEFASIGFDAWGVDFGLLDKEGRLLDMPLCYRNMSDPGIINEACKSMTPWQLHERTGIQLLAINTIFQLYQMSIYKKELLDRADSLLLMPDLLNYFFTGSRYSEYTIATTSQLINVWNQDWDKEIFRQFSLPVEIMSPVILPGNELGNVQAGGKRMSRIKVIVVASHDTASAFAAIPAAPDRTIYISCGTWILVGVQLNEPVITERSFNANFTNEGGIAGTFRFLKNINGLWLLDGFLGDWYKDANLAYDVIEREAAREKPFVFFIDPNDPIFMQPLNMAGKVNEYCRVSGQELPQRLGQFLNCIIDSLSCAVRETVEQLEIILNRHFEKIHMVGGGIANHLLCQRIADTTRLNVYAGPTEATAIGNLMVQIISDCAIKTLDEMHDVINRSFTVDVYRPQDNEWEKGYEVFKEKKVEYKRRKEHGEQSGRESL